MAPSKRKGKKICVFGSGYVGMVTAATFIQMGHRVLLVDIVPEKVALVNKGRSPIFEPGVDMIVRNAVRSGRLAATGDGVSAVQWASMSFICVGTPSRSDGGIDLGHIKKVAKDIGKGLKGRKGHHTVVMKSTVVPSTCEKVVLPILERTSGKKAGKGFGLTCNPEFLKEGEALKDSLEPDRIVIGALDDKARREVEGLYEEMKAPVLRTDLTTAEMIKYASNAFLAAKVGLSNEVANICSAYGVDVYEVMEGVGLDRRIGPLFLRAGAGFGGSCFPKDVKALIMAGRKKKVPLRILPSVIEQNDIQPLETVRMLKDELGNLKGKVIALLGVAFKPDTDDIRETRAYPIARALLKQGAKVRIFDPNKAACDGFMELFPSAKKGLLRAESIEKALRGAHGCIIQTEWAQFKRIGPGTFKRLMKKAVVVDGRRALDPKKMTRAGVTYRGIGWKNR